MRTSAIVLLSVVAVAVGARRGFITDMSCKNDYDCGKDLMGSTLCGCDLDVNLCRDCRECGFGNYGDWSADMTCRMRFQNYDEVCRCEGGFCIMC